MHIYFENGPFFEFHWVISNVPIFSNSAEDMEKRALFEFHKGFSKLNN
jgi:hypothetical protein